LQRVLFGAGVQTDDLVLASALRKGLTKCCVGNIVTESVSEKLGLARINCISAFVRGRSTFELHAEVTIGKRDSTEVKLYAMLCFNASEGGCDFRAEAWEIAFVELHVFVLFLTVYSIIIREKWKEVKFMFLRKSRTYDLSHLLSP